MLSYNNDINLKELLIKEMIKHKEHDQFITGTYGRNDDGNFKGCTIGCAIDSINKILGRSYYTNNHRVLGSILYLPEWILHLQDMLFEHLPNGEGSQFTIDFLSSINVGVDLESIKRELLIFILKENIGTVLNLEKISEELRDKVIDAIKNVLNLYESKEDIAVETWEMAAETAYAAADLATSKIGGLGISIKLSAERAIGYTAERAAVSAAKAATASLVNLERVPAFVENATLQSLWAVGWVAVSLSKPRDIAEKAAAQIYAKELIRLLKDQR